MKKTTGGKRSLRMGDDAVRAKTGKTWAEWFAILDSAGAKKLDHKGIVAILTEKHTLPPWWRQMVTVGYEQERGLRVAHQSPQGFTANASKTINVPLMTLYKAWSDKKARARWLPKPDFEVRRATPGRSMRITWVDKKSNLDVGFVAKGNGKSQVALDHGKLPDASAVERMKKFWSKALQALKEKLEARSAA